MRPSRPTTIVLLDDLPLFRMNVAYAEVNFTISNGFNVSPGLPPIVPLMPEIDLINVILSSCYLPR